MSLHTSAPAGMTGKAVVHEQDHHEALKPDSTTHERLAIYQALEAASPALTWSALPDGRLDYVNPRWVAYTGMELEERVQRGWDTVVHPDDYPRVAEAWARALTSQQPCEAEIRYRRHDGEYRWFHGSVTPVKDASGQTVRWVGTLTDIHDRKMAATRIEQTLESITDSFVSLDADWRYTYINHRAETMLGAGRGDLVGRVIWEVYPHLIGTDFERGLRRAAADNVPYVFEAYSTMQQRWVECHCFPSESGLSVYFHSIDDRKHHEAELVARTERLQQLTDTLNLALDAAKMVAWEWDPQLDRVNTSGNAEDVFGATPVGTRAEGLTHLHPDDVEVHQAAIRKVAETGGELKCKFRIIRPDNGQTVWTEERCRAILDEDGRCVKMVGVVQDVTDSVLAEAEVVALKDAAAARLQEFETLVETVPVAIFIADDPECRRIRAANAVSRAWFSTAAPDVATANLSASAPPDERATFFRHMRNGVELTADELPMQRAAKTGTPVGPAEIDYVWGDGRVWHILGHASPLFGPDGEVQGSIGAFVDVTKQKDRDEELREKQKELERITDATSAMLTRCSRDLRYLFVNRAYAEMVGMAREEITGRPIVDVMGAAGFDAIRPHVERALAGEIVHYEAEVPFRTVGKRFLRVTYVPDRDGDGDVAGWFASVLDITPEKEAEAALLRAEHDLRESQKRTEADLRAMTRLQEVSNLCLRPDVELRTCLEAILESAVEFTGADKGNVQLTEPGSTTLRIASSRGFAQPFLDFFAAVDEDVAAVCTAASRAAGRVIVEDILSSELFRGQPSLAVLRDEGVRGVQSTPMISSTRQVLGTISTHYTHPYAPGEQELRQMDLLARLAADYLERRQVEQTLRAHMAEIESLNVRMQHAMRETHHRVKNNLQIVSAMVDIQSLTHDESVPVTELHRIGQHIRSLATIHDLLTGSRPDEGESETVLTRDLIAKLAPLIQTAAGERPIRFDFADVPLGLRQSTSLAVLINELVSNAVKHGKGEIDVRLTAEDRAIRLSVRDCGPGFPDEFDPNRAANTGLDLIEIVSRHDLQGRTHYRNRPQGGAEVIVEFPRS